MFWEQESKTETSFKKRFKTSAMFRVGLRGDTREGLTTLHCSRSFVLTVLNMMCQHMLGNQVLGIEGAGLKFTC